MKITINLNEIVKVKLTDYGKEIFYKHYEGSIGPRAILNLDQDGYSEFQLWQLMNIFGAYMNLGNREVLDPLEIIVKRI